MTRFGNNGVWSLSLASVMAVIGVITGSTDPTLAQIVPDQTLGAEPSQVMPNVDVRGGLADRIDGGAIRGVNLFHSFGEFNVRDLQRVYFANPEGIENILGRVTGSNRSDIFGTLGVDGGANLFLINPNGIVFGPNAQLDIRGSFVAGTADRFKFPDGSEFRATNPNAPPLVTVNIPIGLQYGAEPPAALVSEADLAVGQSLMLSGGAVTSTGHLSAPEGLVVVEGVAGDVQVQDVTAQSATLYSSQVLSLEESQLKTAGDLNLVAEQTVRVRDSVENSFLALAGGTLLIQGKESIDILALNHPQTPFQTRGNLTLVSDGTISGDAHFYSGGNFSILNFAGEPGTFSSLYDPIISVNGDVIFGDYEGPALKVEATGSIIAGNITITSPDQALAGGYEQTGNVSPIAFGENLESTLISNEGGSVSSAALEAFLGLESGTLTGLNNGSPTEGSAIKLTFSVQSTLDVQFDWSFLTGESGLPFNDFAFVTITSPDGTSSAQTLASADTPGLQPNSFLTTLDHPEFDPDDNPEPENPVEFVVGIGITDVGDTSVASSLTVNNFSPDVTLSNDPDAPTLGSTPALILKAGVPLDNPTPNELLEGDLEDEFIGINELPLPTPGFTAPGLAFPTPDQTLLPQGSIQVGSLNTSGFSNTEGISGGPVILSATGNIDITGDIITSGETTTDMDNTIGGNAGDVTITAGGTVAITDSFISTTSNAGGNAGDITISAGSTSINPDFPAIKLTDVSIDAAAFGDTGETGNITINAVNEGAISLVGNDFRRTIFTDTFASDDRVIGETTGGNITITGGLITISNYNLDATVRDESKGDGGDIFINGTSISIQNNTRIATSVNVSDNLDQGDGGDIAITTNGGAIKIENNSSVTAGTEGIGNSGSVIVEAIGGSITIENGSEVVASSTSQVNVGTVGGDAGNVDVEANSVEVNNSLISTSTEGTTAGNVFIDANESVTLSGTFFPEGNFEPQGGLLAGAGNGGTGGNLTIETGQLTIQQGASASVSGTGSGSAGSLNVDANSIKLTDGGTLSADTELSNINGGISLLALETLEVIDSTISTSTDFGIAGDLLIAVNEFVQLEGTTPEGKPAGLFATAEEGVAGNLTITTPQLTVQNGAQAAVNSAGTGSAGSLTVNAGNISLTNQAALKADSTESIEGGNIILRGVTEPGIVEQQPLVSLQVIDSLVSASTESGQAGDVIVKTIDSVVLSGTYQDELAGLLAQATAGGNAGDLEVSTNQLTIQNGAQAAVSSEGVKPTENTSGNAGNITVTANTVKLNDGGQIAAETEGGGSTNTGNILLEGLDTLTVNNSLISSSTQSGVAGSVSIDASESVTLNGTFIPPGENEAQGGVLAEATTGGKAGSVSITTNQLTIQEGAAAAVSSEEGTGEAGNVTIDANLVTLNSGGQIAAETDEGGSEGSANINLIGLETLEVNNGLISSSTNSGVAGSVSINALESVTLSGTFIPPGEDEAQGGVLAEATAGGNAGSVSIITNQLTIQEGAQAAVSSDEGDGEAGNVTIDANLVTLNSGGQIAAETDEGGSDGSANINLVGLETLAVNNGLISSSTNSGVAGSVTIDAANAVTLSGTFIPPGEDEAQGGVLAQAEQGGEAGSVTITTNQLTIADEAAVAVSSQGVKPTDDTPGNAGDVKITANTVTVNSGGQITAETDGGGSNTTGNILLQGLETLEVNDGNISASTNTGVAGSVSINASESVELDEGSRIAVIAKGDNGTAGNVTINTGDFLVRDDSEVSVSSRFGEAGDLNVNAGFIGLNRGRLTADAGQGEGANINLNVSGFLGFLRLDNESLISALATGNATGGNININAQYVIASFPTGSEGSDIVADAELGNGGQITINALGIFGLDFRPARTPLNDITASSQGGAAGTVQITTLGIDPSRGLAALPLNFIDVSGLVGGQCSASGADGELSQFTIIGRGGLPLNPTDPLAPEAEASDWVTFDPESDRISPQAHTPIRITPFTSSVSPDQLAQFPSLCYQSWSSSAIAP